MAADREKLPWIFFFVAGLKFAAGKKKEMQTTTGKWMHRGEVNTQVAGVDNVWRQRTELSVFSMESEWV